ncbi:hypothetical protein SARC_15142 [Sphaeroforma arctica JP610]|uniref:Uncharacterized protein n=1 Tax=Sphaeroforma arctica JP610 TaxID=667725 RepID=A0A0L0F6F5_9EUKA|nr:hypothetical protein SARC_15142 [Sphaeroforma arctica JP610]KNC72305.1 hypothetical protein SARC_15142 [Sphaeroforma arctica JP610]|eukprot:XP_014146207.1 hypothetical protein SARC_15142 [Sphaeroforma arctica JP610]
MVDRARDFCPQIQSINPDVIESLSGIVDVLFDNVFTDAIAGKKIKASMERIVRQHKYLTEGLSWVHSRANELNVKYSAKKQKYKSVKSQLVNHRNALMKQAASGQQNWLAPNARQAQPQQNLTPQQYGQYPAAPPSPRPDQAEAFDIMAPVVGVPQLDPNNPFGSIDQIPEAPPMDGNNPYGYAPPPGQFGGYAPAPGIYGQAPPPPEQYGQAPPYQGQYAQAPPQYGATQGYAPQEHYQQQPPPPADQETPEKKPIAPEGYPQ